MEAYEDGKQEIMAVSKTPMWIMEEDKVSMVKQGTTMRQGTKRVSGE